LISFYFWFWAKSLKADPSLSSLISFLIFVLLHISFRRELWSFHEFISFMLFLLLLKTSLIYCSQIRSRCLDYYVVFEIYFV